MIKDQEIPTINRAQKLNPPPEKIHLSNNMQLNQCIDHINYETHPAYAPLINSPSFSTRLSSLLTFIKFNYLVLLKRLISYELIPTHLRNPKNAATFMSTGKKIIQNIANKCKPKTKHHFTDAEIDVFNALDQQGICVMKMVQNDIETLSNTASPLINAFRKKRQQNKDGVRKFTDSRSTALRTTHADLYHSVQSILDASGIIGGISKYLGRVANVIDINPQINDCSDDFWRRCFPDLSIENPSTAYGHRDASGGDVKAIFYLSDVEKENGPFSFMLGSHRNRPNWLMNTIQETNDTSGHSSTTPEMRKAFAALPKFLRKKCSFGNDLEEGCEKTEHILKSEWQILGQKGHVVVFDSKGFHRGGMVSKGERVVLTCVIG